MNNGYNVPPLEVIRSAIKILDRDELELYAAFSAYALVALAKQTGKHPYVDFYSPVGSSKQLTIDKIAEISERVHDRIQRLSTELN